MAATLTNDSGLTAGESGGWIETLARVGYAAKGFVYLIIGALALQLAFSSGGDAVGPKGAVSSLAGEPFGRILIALTAAGLFCYSAWRFVQAAKDPEGKGSDAKGIAARVGYTCSAIAYATVGIEAVRILMSGGGGQGGGASHWTAKLMEMPMGRWLVAIASLAMLGAGGYQFYRGYSAKFQKLLKSEEMSSEEITWGERLGRVGFMARGVVYFIIGSFLVVAAYQTDPQQAKGVGGALEYLTTTGWGPWVLGIIAAGLFAYGAFSVLILARYRRILGS